MADIDNDLLTDAATNLLTEEHRSLFRDLLQNALQTLIEEELTASIGAALHERTDDRTGQRNGHRPPRTLSTPAGDVELAIPKVRAGNFYPSLLEPRRRVDQALWAVIMTAYVKGTSTRKVDDLVKALGVDSGVSKSTVSRICKEMDGHVEAFRARTLAHTDFPYVFCDATYVKGRVGRHVVSRAIVVAFGVAADGTREVLGLDVGDSEDEAFWGAFLRSLKTRGLGGVQLVISDAHEGLKAAIRRHLQGAAWQRSSVHHDRHGQGILSATRSGRAPWQRDLRGSYGRACASPPRWPGRSASESSADEHRDERQTSRPPRHWGSSSYEGSMTCPKCSSGSTGASTTTTSPQSIATAASWSTAGSPTTSLDYRSSTTSWPRSTARCRSRWSDPKDWWSNGSSRRATGSTR
jgi:hypothetical protein